MIAAARWNSDTTSTKRYIKHAREAQAGNKHTSSSRRTPPCRTPEWKNSKVMPVELTADTIRTIARVRRNASAQAPVEVDGDASATAAEVCAAAGVSATQTVTEYMARMAAWRKRELKHSRLALKAAGHAPALRPARCSPTSQQHATR
jgi:hypothetical protein